MAVAPVAVRAPLPVDVDVTAITRAAVERIKADSAFAEQVAERLMGKDAFFAVASFALIAGDETHQVEFKSTARWNLREGTKDERMEDAVVKTIAGFLNTDGGTLFIGVDDRGTPIGLAHDTALIKPPNVDGFVQLAHDASRHGADENRGDANAGEDRGDRRRRDLPYRRRAVLEARDGADERQGQEVLGADEQQHPCAVRDRDGGLLPGPLVAGSAATSNGSPV